MELKSVVLEHLPEQFTGVAPTKKLIESIRQNGVIQPIIIIKGEVVAGRRRIQAARIVGLTEIPAVEIESETEPEVIGIIENTHRNSNPASEAEMIQSLLNRGYDEEEIRLMTGMSKTVYRNRAAILELLPDIKSEFFKGKIAVGVASAIGKCSKVEQRQLLKVLRDKGKLTKTDVTALKQLKTQNQADSLPEDLFEDTPQVHWKKQVENLMNQIQEVSPDRVSAIAEVLTAEERQKLLEAINAKAKSRTV